MNLEEKIKKLKEICSVYEYRDFHTFLAGVLLQISQRHESPLFKNLLSPMRQLFYLAQLNLQSCSNENKIGFEEKVWEEMTQLLYDIEMDYFMMLGYPKNGYETREEIEKIKVAMPTFMNYFFNGSLCYQEQEIERIETVFKEFNLDIFNEFQLELRDFINFYDFINKIINENLNATFKYLNPDNWKKFTDSCIEKGLHDPKDWLIEAPEEVFAFLEYYKNPGSFLIIDTSKINYEEISKDKCERVFKLLKAERNPQENITYYTEGNILLQKPFIGISENKFLPFFFKQYLDATYNLLFNFCLKVDRDKILKCRDMFLENKIFKIFKDFFPKEAFIYSNYSVDEYETEQDILILYKRNAIIIEAKAGSYRAPMRDPIKAFDKIKSDFKGIIQNGYDQTLRVKKRFWTKDKIRITNRKKELLYEIPPNRYRNIYSIVVTLEKFGMIQTDLGDMLKIDDNDEFPWSVNIDDLEILILMLTKDKSRVQQLVNFLEFRQNFHTHTLCSDELELIGLFFKDFKEFKTLSLSDEHVVTLPDLTTPIENAYKEGLGFKNERFLKKKRNNKINFLYEK